MHWSVVSTQIVLRRGETFAMKLIPKNDDGTLFDLGNLDYVDMSLTVHGTQVDTGTTRNNLSVLKIEQSAAEGYLFINIPSDNTRRYPVGQLVVNLVVSYYDAARNRKTETPSIPTMSIVTSQITEYLWRENQAQQSGFDPNRIPQLSFQYDGNQRVLVEGSQSDLDALIAQGGRIALLRWRRIGKWQKEYPDGRYKYHKTSGRWVFPNEFMVEGSENPPFPKVSTFFLPTQIGQWTPLKSIRLNGSPGVIPLQAVARQWTVSDGVKWGIRKSRGTVEICQGPGPKSASSFYAFGIQIPIFTPMNVAPQYKYIHIQPVVFNFHMLKNKDTGQYDFYPRSGMTFI